MRNYKGSFYRTDEISKEPDQCPEWIDLLATKIRIDSEKIASASSKTAVEVARERNHQPSIYEMMSAIVSGQKPKYSSVEEAVQDYQRRTGLAEYLKRAGDGDLSVLAGQIVAEAAKGDEDESEKDEKEEEEEDKDEEGDDEDDEEDEDKDDAFDFLKRNHDYGERGPNYGERPSDRDYHPDDLMDEYKRQKEEDELAAEGNELDRGPAFPEFDEDKELKEYNAGRGKEIRNWRDAFKTDPDDPDVSDEERNERTEKFLERSEEFGDVRDMTEEELEANPGKKKLISEAEEEKPELLVKNPSIEHFLTNIIDTNIGIQVPAILHSLLETFGRDGVDHQIFSDRPLLNWINAKLISKGVTKNDAPSQIGRGVGTHVEYSGDKDSNKDPFTLLVPDKGML